LHTKSIKDRLEIWGRYQRDGTHHAGGRMALRETRSFSRGGSGGGCMTAVVCNIMATAAAGPAGWNEPARGGAKFTKSQLEDVNLITAAWIELPERPKLVLKHAYVLNSPPVVICRKLLIPHWPARHFKRELDAAESAIVQMLDIVQNRNKIPDNNSFPSG
jgi:hypothetical protein